MPSRFARELRALRQRLGLTQAEMAHRLHVDPSRISRWEHNEVPPAPVIERIGSTFQVDAFAWLHEEPEAPAEPRLVHLKAVPRPEADEGGWRGKAIDLLTRMTDLLESIVKNARGGGGKPILGRTLIVQ